MQDQSESIKKAAELILAADFLVVGTGAGMSADSGLPLYNDTQRVPAYIERRLTYMNLCTPGWNFEDPETFYGFWGASMKQFREAEPHDGYSILKKWRDQLFSESSEEFKTALMKLQNITNPPGPFFVYTSNVDGLHLRSGLKSTELIEIHGNIETWQCSQVCSSETWSAPPDFVFKVDLATMLAAKEEKGEEEEEDFTKNNGFISNHPRCKMCGQPARPAILMFGDFYWVRQKTLWSPWRDTVGNLIEQNPTLSLVIIEIGCGKNVPSVRCMAESFLDSAPTQVNIIRINRDFILPDFSTNTERILGIKGGGREVLQAIDDAIQQNTNK